MQFPAVNWHEGLFLQPHHFQAWDRHWSERVAAGEQWQNPHSYGIFQIDVNSVALAAGFIQLDSLKAKTPAGTLIELAAGQQSQRCDLREALQRIATEPESASQNQSSARVDVYLGVPRLRLGGANVASEPESNGTRFRAELLDLPDESDASSVQPVELRKINAHILLSGQDLAGYDALPIARVMRSADGASLELDPDFVPPLLDCAAWPSLRSSVLCPIADLLLQASERAGQAVADAGDTLQAGSTLQLQRLLLLQAVNPAAAAFRLLATGHGFHPQTAYLELVKLAAALDLFRKQRMIQPVRPYDHNDLGPLFRAVKDRITAVLASVDEQAYYQRFFTGYANGLQTNIDYPAASSKTRWYIGVYKGKLPTEILHRVLAPAHLDWKLGAAEQVEWLFTHRAPGVDLMPVKDRPEVLPSGTDWAYFEIDQSSAAWVEAWKTRTLAMRLKDTLIVNADKLKGGKQLVVEYEKHAVALQFALFGVG